MQVTDLYREEILDHYQNPHNFGKVDGSDAHSRQTNPLCGDDIAIWVKFNNNGKSAGVNISPPQGWTVRDIGFVGKGCAICMAGASMLTDFAKGKSKIELTKFSENDMLELLGIEVSETRKKCVMLSLAVLKDCLH